MKQIVFLTLMTIFSTASFAESIFDQIPLPASERVKLSLWHEGIDSFKQADNINATKLADSSPQLSEELEKALRN